MKKLLFFFITAFIINHSSVRAQLAQDYLLKCVEETIMQGATKKILSGTLCSACEDTLSSLLFFNSPNGNYFLRYIKYFDGYDMVKIIQDTTIVDNQIKGIFDLLEKNQDSIYLTISNLKDLLTIEQIKDGKIVLREPMNHGKFKLFNVYLNGASCNSLESVLNLNLIHDRAYYYWLINSSINNYLVDSGKLIFGYVK